METQQRLDSFITGSPLPTRGERTWGTVAHVSGLVLPVLGPLLVMLLTGDDSSWVQRQAKEAINFQLTVLAVSAVLFVAGLLLFCLGGFLLWKLLAPLSLAFIAATVYAGIKANEGVLFRYPVNVRLFK
jgi:uncharacterized protein